MASTYQIAEAGDLGIAPEQVMDFIRGEWKRPLALSHERFYTWQFKDVPGAGQRDRCVLVAAGDHIVGYMGLNPRTFYLDGEARNGAELTTWMISEEARGKGYAPKILDYLKNTYEVLVGMGITAMALPVYTRSGFRYVRHIPRMVRLFNPEKVLEVSEADSLARKLARQASKMKVPSVTAEEIAWDAFEREGGVTQDAHNTFARTPAYMTWRYGDHPTYPYKAYRVSSGEASAVVVLRMDASEDLKVLHVMDLLGDPAAYEDAVAFVESYGRDEGADFSDFFCVADEVLHPFWKRSWFSTLDDDFIQVPHLYYPLEVRKPPTTSLILWTRHENTSFLRRDRLYITKQDCDLDRPTQAYLDLHGWR